MSEDKIISADDAKLQERAKLLAELSDITTAADEVSRLREENARLRAALKPLIEIKDYPDAVLMQRIRAAAAALKEAKNG